MAPQVRFEGLSSECWAVLANRTLVKIFGWFGFVARADVFEVSSYRVYLFGVLRFKVLEHFF